MANGVDFSFSRFSGAELKANGYSFACRYLASDSSKRISANEVTDFHNNGIDLVLVWEDDATAALNGFNQGQHDATTALEQANAIGWPANLPLYFAVDFDVQPSQLAVCGEYFKGVISVLGLNRTGGYGGLALIKYLLDNSLITVAWQTVAWSGGNVDPRINIYQNGQSTLGGGADIDESRQGNFGQWSAGGEEDMVDDAGARLILKASTLLAVDGDAPDRQPTIEEVTNLIGRSYNDALQQVTSYTPWGANWNKVKHYDGDVAALKAQLMDTSPPSPAAAPLPNLTNNIPSAGNTLPAQSNFLHKIWTAIFG